METCTLFFFFFFTFLCLVAQATPSGLKRKSFTWIDQVAGVPCYSVTPNKQQSSHFGQREEILGVEDGDLKLALNPIDRLCSGLKTRCTSKREWEREYQRSLKALSKVNIGSIQEGGQGESKNWTGNRDNMRVSF